MLSDHHVEFGLGPGLADGPERGEEMDAVSEEPEVEHHEFASLVGAFPEGGVGVGGVCGRHGDSIDGR